jgi:hypothetical protein
VRHDSLISDTTFSTYILDFLSPLTVKRRMESDSVFLTRAKTAAGGRQAARPTTASRVSSTAPVGHRIVQAPRRVLTFFRDPMSFGAGSPSWTIGSSRHPPRPPPDYPAPCHYDVPLDPFHTQLSHTIRDREWEDYRTVTSDVDLLEIRKFPDVRRATIGVLDGTSYVQPSDAPGPNWFPGDYIPEHDYTSHSISSFHPDPPNLVPGAGAYTPSDPGRPSSAMVSLRSGSLKRFHDVNQDSVPGPGEYQIGPIVRKAPNWAQKLRVMPKSHTPVKTIDLQVY